MPTEIDEVERKLVQLEIERQALKKEKDKASRSVWRRSSGSWPTSRSSRRG